jgi:hypothetical protein
VDESTGTHDDLVQTWKGRKSFLQVQMSGFGNIQWDGRALVKRNFSPGEERQRQAVFLLESTQILSWSGGERRKARNHSSSVSAHGALPAPRLWNARIRPDFEAIGRAAQLFEFSLSVRPPLPPRCRRESAPIHLCHCSLSLLCFFTSRARALGPAGSRLAPAGGAASRRTPQLPQMVGWEEMWSRDGGLKPGH